MRQTMQSVFANEPREQDLPHDLDMPPAAGEDDLPSTMEGRMIDLNEYSYERDVHELESSRRLGGNGLPPNNGYVNGPNGVGAIDTDDVTFNNSTIATDDVGHDITRLYVICEEAFNRQGAAAASQSRNHRMADVIASTWDAIREWLAAHPMPGERSVAASYQGQFMTTALHIVCKLPCPPTDVVRSLIECAPETVAWADSSDWLPLHHACANGASYDVLSLLVETYPNSKVAQDRRRRTPLHFSFSTARADVHNQQQQQGQQHQQQQRHGSNTMLDEKGNTADDDSNAGGGTDSICDVVRLLSDSGAAKLCDETGKLPIHYACAYGTSADVLKVLVEAYPDSIFAKEQNGRTPLHLAMVNAHRPASLSVLSFLLSVRGADIINISDNFGHLPLHLLAMACKLSADKVEERHNVTECLRMYLAAEPKPSADFLQALQSLPDWLRDQAVVCPHVQNILNKKIGKRFPTFILMVDGYCLIAIIICFEIASSQFIQNQFGKEDGTVETTQAAVQSMGCVYFLFVGGAYFLLREVVQMISLASLGTFSSWYHDFNNWLDVLIITLTISFGIEMTVGEATISNDSFRTGVAFSKGVFWTGFIAFLKSIRIEFAVFVSGVLYVVQRLTAFLIAMAVILLAFAQMFQIVYKETSTCDQENTYFPHCSLGASLLRVYTMMMGEVGDADVTYRDSNVAIVLFVAYAFLVVIVLSTVLIAIVVDSYGVIKNERAAMVFWSNRLDFVAEMDAILRVLKRGANCLCCESKTPKSKPGGPGHADGFIADSMQNETHLPAEEEKDRFFKAWKSLMSLLDTEDNDFEYWGYDFWCYTVFRLIALVFIIPLWLVLGAATAGVLWPPQVRSWLFVQGHSAVTQADIEQETTRNIKSLKEELSALRAELKVEVRSDRKEVAQMQDEVDCAREHILSDFSQMKVLMTTLLESTREKVRRKEMRRGG